MLSYFISLDICPLLLAISLYAQCFLLIEGSRTCDQINDFPQRTDG